MKFNNKRNRKSKNANEGKNKNTLTQPAVS